MKISPYYPKGTEVLHSRYCDCQVDWGPDGPEGPSTKRVYLGEGRFMCPICGQLEDIHGAVFKLIVEVKKEYDEEESWWSITVLKPILDKRLIKKNKGDCATMLEVLKDVFAEEAEDLVDGHDEGFFLWEFFYTSWFDDEDGDTDFAIVSERRLAKQTMEVY